jgi:hypothetical protein
VTDRDKLLKIFGQHTETDADLHSVDGLINLFNLVAFSAGHSIKQVPFPAILDPCGTQIAFPGQRQLVQTPCYVSADPGALRFAFHVFMSATPAPAAGKAAGAAAAPRPAPPPHKSSAPKPTGGLTGDLNDGKAQAAALGRIAMPVYVPRVIAAGSSYCTNATCPIGPVANSYPRGYLVHDQTGAPHVSYRMTLVANSVLGQYYGVEGTTWRSPPILDNPSGTRIVNGKQLLLFANGGKISLVGWRGPGGAYWISNTLTDSIGNRQMIAIAASLAPAGH